MRQWTFHSLCSQLKSNRDLSDSAEDLNTLIGAASSLLGESTTEGLTRFIGTLAEKDKFISLCGNILEALRSRKPEDYSGRIDQMREAYGILCFTAFFDELDRQLPDSIRKSIQLSLPEKKDIMERAAGRKAEEYRARLDIVLPDIMLEVGAIDTFLEETYRSMATTLRAFTNGLSFHETASEREIRTFEEILNGLPKAALRRFHSQYLVLCTKFNEFYIFMQLEQLAQQERKWDDRYQAILTAAMRTPEPIEAGLVSLRNLILELPNGVRDRKIQDITDEIIRKYRSDIERPLIGTQEQSSADDDLRYPLISEGFIPQAYKLLKYSGSEHLELPKTWEPLTAQQDMMPFWARYCLDPGSTESLLLILGEPGGGKSLLTKVLCARMCAPASMFVRIPLRDHDVEDEIENIVCRQISFDGDASEQIPTFKWFVEGSPDAPMTLVFDGYDEVLQATGGVYRALLNKIQKFQNRCRSLRRPVRIIVTSRETLIDKTEIPEGTMVMKLLEFDSPRKDQWIGIWNAHNHTVLSEAGICDFSLPENSQDIDDLSSQPLLLMMLAMYDADFETGTNALKPKEGQVEKLDRTKLYDELLRRFVRRELRKGHRGNEVPFDEREEAEKNTLVDEEMRKLGIAALGMFVREKLSLEVGELDNDLEYMKIRFPDYAARNTTMLKNAEVFLGSFFFIHDPRRKNGPDEKKAASKFLHKNGPEEKVAFEFLHKTFYEFLVADFILQNLLDAVDEMDGIRSARKYGDANYWKALDRTDSFRNAYYVALGGAFLCMEPEIIQMAAEWKACKLYARFGNEPSVTSQMIHQVMEDIFQSHMDMIRSGTFHPAAWVKGGLSGEHSCPQACAVYLLNLLILRVLFQGQCRIKIKDWSFISRFVQLNAPPPKKKDVAEGGFVLQEKLLPSEEIILRFMALFQLRRKDNTILIEKRNQAKEVEQQSLLEARINIFDFAQDAAARAICKLHDATAPIQEKEKYQENLCRQGFHDFEFERHILQLKGALLITNPVHFPSDLIQASITCLIHREIEPSLTLEWLLCIQQLIRINGRTFPMKYQEYQLHEQFKTYPHEPFIDVNSWKHLRDVVFTRYIDYVVVIQTFLAVIKEIGCSAMLIEDEDFIWDVIPKLARRPEQFSIFFMAIADAIPMCLSIRANYSILNIIDRLVLEDTMCAFTSTKGTIAVLKAYSLTFRPTNRTSMAVISDDIIRSSLKYSLDYPSEDLPELLRVCLQMGYFQEVKNFFADLPRNWCYQLLGKDFNIVGELFDIAKVVKRDQAFLRCIAPQIARNWRDVDQYPGMFMKLVLQAIKDKKPIEHVNADMLISHFLATYREMFKFSMDDAVYLLHLIFKRNPISRDFELAYIHSVKYYQSLLERSVKGAARLLTMYEEMEGTRKQTIIKQMEGTFVPTFSIIRCFNKAMSIRDRRSVSQLIELLDSLEAEEKVALAGYFAEQRPYLRSYSNLLSRKLEEMYP